MEDITRPTIMEVDLEALKYNIKQIKEFVGESVTLMPVIKASGYGTHINRRLEILNMFDIVAVAIVDEAIELRNVGYEKDIFVLNQPYKDEIDKIAKYDISVGISSLSFLEKLGASTGNFKVHIEIGTGMGRTGIHPKRVKEFFEKVETYKNITIEGMYTHLSSADIDNEYTLKQLKSFEFALNKEKECHGKIKYIHSLASNGILNYPGSYYTLVRPGIILYGYESCDDTFKKINLRPICKLKSKVTFVKEVKEGTSIGYSRSFVTNRETKVATIPIGYADGFRRSLSNKGEVIINGHKVPVIGNICMDSFMADITDFEDISVGDDVYIWDNEIIKLEDVAKECDTINYEIMCMISERVPRIFINTNS